MADLRLTVDVAAPAAVVFAAATDWDRQGEWMLGTRVRGTHLGGHAVGGRLEAFTGVGRVGFLDTMEVTTWDPPRRCEVLHTGRVVRGTGVFLVEDLGGGRSRFVWSEQLDLPLGAVGRAGWRLLRPVFSAAVLASLRKFARWTEERTSRL